MESAAKDNELDIASEAFNPLRCLYAIDYRVTEKQPKVMYQNMAAFETALKNLGIWEVGRKPKSQKHQQQQPGTSKQAATLVEEQKTTRRFQEHQMAIRTEKRIKNKHTRNILGQMTQATGPLKALNDYVSTGKRIHIVVRKEKGIKGYLEGCLKLFDRHWNLLLTEVEECYVQRKPKYVEDKLVITGIADCTQRLQQLGIVLPRQTRVRSLNRKQVEIRRFLPQLVIRGEHVVVVYPAQKVSANETTRKSS